jgi:hypothetical protein
MSSPVVNAIAAALKAGKYPARKFGKRENKQIESVLDSTVKLVEATYDATVNGGALGTYTLGVSIPAGAVVTAAWCDIQTGLAGASGSLTLNVPTEGALTQALTSAANGSASVVASTALPKKVAAARTLQVTVTGGALSAGKIVFHVQYV